MTRLGLARSTVQRCALGLALGLMLGPAQAVTLPVPDPGELQLAWLDARGQPHHVVLGARGQVRQQAVATWPADAASAEVPLGSLWKLAAYARLSEATAPQAERAPEPPYTCSGQSPDEVYCCEPGQRIDRATALWRSCGLYFAASRLALPSAALGATLAALPASMQALRQPDVASERTTVPLDDWLRWLALWAPATQQAARDDLLPYWLDGPGRAALGGVGSRLRVKTFTLPLQRGSAERWGGASGWLADGRPVWLAARGSSKFVLPHWAPLALRHIDRTEGAALALPHPQSPCIEVSYLQRYPIAQLRDAQGHPVATASPPLPAGDYTAEFRAGHRLAVHSQGDLFWRRTPPGDPQLVGRHTLEDYVARVVDREGRADVPAAAQALAVAARTYVLRTARAQGGCLRIDDSSAAQRVAPRPPTEAARQAASLTAGLVLRRHEGQYHSTQARAGVMAWQDAVAQAEAGYSFERILGEAYGSDPLQSAFGRSGAQCEALPDAQAWLNRQLVAWRQRLQGQPGFTAVSAVEVCRLQAGLPHARQRGAQVFVRDFRSQDDRLTLAHEYLHLAFAGHPRASQEAFIEQQARVLLGVL